MFSTDKPRQMCFPLSSTSMRQSAQIASEGNVEKTDCKALYISLSFITFMLLKSAAMQTVYEVKS